MREFGSVFKLEEKEKEEDEYVTLAGMCNDRWEEGCTRPHACFYQIRLNTDRQLLDKAFELSKGYSVFCDGRDKLRWCEPDHHISTLVAVRV